MKNKIKLLDLLNEDDRKLLIYCYKFIIVRFYGNKYDYIKEDIFSNAYVCLLECYKNNYDIHKTFRAVENCMGRFVYSLGNILSIDENLKDDENKITLLNLMACEDFNIIDSNIECIKKCYFDCLNLFDDKEKNIINDYILYRKNIHKILKKNNISLYHGGKTYFVDLIRKFRKNIAFLLKSFDIHTKYLLRNDEFTKLEMKYKRTLEREKVRKNNKDVYYNDVYIYSLIRDNYKKEYSDLLDIPEDRLKNIIYHTGCAKFKLYLKDIQLLRKNYFKNYSFDKLCEVSDVYL